MRADAAMPTGKPCDPCRHAPAYAQAACRLQQSGEYTHASCSRNTQQCDWITGEERTLAVHHDERRVRGWGNIWTYLRTLHYVAALLGRRMLFTHADNTLPSNALWLGSKRSSRLAQNATHQYYEVTNADVAAWTASHNASESSLSSASGITGLLGLLDALHSKPHIMVRAGSFYISKWQHVSAGCKEPHSTAFLNCVGRLFSSPSPRMKPAFDQLRSQLSHNFTAIHIRTFGADMHVPHRQTPDPASALRFLAWEITAGNSSSLSPEVYAAELRRWCARAVRDERAETGRRKLYVASDSKVATLMVHNICGAGIGSERELDGQAGIVDVVSLGPKYGGVRMHMEQRTQLKGTSTAMREAGVSSSVLDWLILSHAREAVRFGATHSTFVSSAANAGCGVKLRKYAEHAGWKYKSAAPWVLRKMEEVERWRPPKNGNDCATGIAAMLNRTPCGTPCLAKCRAAIHAAYA